MVTRKVFREIRTSIFIAIGLDDSLMYLINAVFMFDALQSEDNNGELLLQCLGQSCAE